MTRVMAATGNEQRTRLERGTRLKTNQPSPVTGSYGIEQLQEFPPVGLRARNLFAVNFAAARLAQLLKLGVERDAADEPRRIVAHYSLRSLLDDLFGAREHRLRNREAEILGGFQYKSVKA